MAEKSLLITYLLWLTVGWFGIHHIYLRRDRHAFVWFWTMGGCFGAGWLAEAWRLPSYVEDANRSPTVKKKYRTRTPEFSWKRFVGEVVFSWFIGNVSLSAVPEETIANWPVLKLVSPFFVALGVHTVANIGDQRCSYLISVAGACVALPLLLFHDPTLTQSAVTYSCLLSAGVANYWGRSWQQCGTCRKQHICVRLVILFIASLATFAMIVSMICFNSHITTRDGERIRIKDAVQNILSSPVWAEFRQTVRRLFDNLLNEGFDRFKRELSIVLDPEGEESAYMMLGLPASASEQEITKRYRQLVRQFHPDKVNMNTKDKRIVAEKRFMEIQHAYEHLSQIKRRRLSRHNVEL